MLGGSDVVSSTSSLTVSPLVTYRHEAEILAGKVRFWTGLQQRSHLYLEPSPTCMTGPQVASRCASRRSSFNGGGELVRRIAPPGSSEVAQKNQTQWQRRMAKFTAYINTLEERRLNARSRWILGYPEVGPARGQPAIAGAKSHSIQETIVGL